MNATYKHTSITVRDWRILASFYEQVFGCSRVPPERDCSGEWLSRGTGVADAHFTGVHLRLPGHGDNGPTLEICQYDKNEVRSPCAANREGIGHIAFEVDSVSDAVAQVIEHGGRMVGEVVKTDIPALGRLTFVYMADPEGNIIELQSWG